jgi:hypothetical protein
MMTKKIFIHAPTYVGAVILFLVLSSMIEATVWAEKPAKPGKPPHGPETADFEIKIGVGSGPQDITLNPPDTSLWVRNLDYYGRWLPPPKKGKYYFERWSVDSMNPGEGQWDSCGTYIITNVENEEGFFLIDELNTHGIDSSAPAYGFTIYHNTQNRPGSTYNDYWYILIAWKVGTLSSDPDIPHLHALMGLTNPDNEWEGVYDKINDTWTVTFDNAEFVVISNCGNDGEIVQLWEGSLRLTINITRTLV